MVELLIMIPVLRRPQNILPLVTSIKENTPDPYDILFLASPGDYGEIKELEKQKQSYIVMNRNYENNGDYARKLNTGFNFRKANWYFLGADDLKFHHGWFEAAMVSHKLTNSCVIGTNDLGNPIVTSGKHSTHSLVLRDYVLECGTIDEPGKILHEGYKHNFVDTEFIATAQWRGAWTFSKNSWVEHLHPDWKKGKRDEIYEIGKSGFVSDQKYFEKRKRLWP